MNNNMNISINTNTNEQTIKAINNSKGVKTNSRYVTIMGMNFDTAKEEVPDFGSIRLVDSNGQDANQYFLNSEDVSKLNLITNAGDGSLAYCLDTKKLYARHEDTWKEV